MQLCIYIYMNSLRLDRRVVINYANTIYINFMYTNAASIVIEVSARASAGLAHALLPRELRDVRDIHIVCDPRITHMGLCM